MAMMGRLNIEFHRSARATKNYIKNWTVDYEFFEMTKTALQLVKLSLV
jgi:hypothetical protein